MTILHVKSTGAETITEAITSFLNEKKLNYRKLVGQGYDGAATFSGVNTGVQRRLESPCTPCSLYSLLLPPQPSASFYSGCRISSSHQKNVWYNDQPLEDVPLLAQRPP